MLVARNMVAVLLTVGMLMTVPSTVRAQISRIAEVVSLLMETGDMVNADRREQVRALSRSDRIDQVVRSVYHSHGHTLREGMWPSYHAHEMLRVLRELSEWSLPHHRDAAREIAEVFGSADKVVEDVCHAILDPTVDLDFLMGMLLGSAERVTHAELLLLRSFAEMERETTPRGKKASKSRLVRRVIRATKEPDVYARDLFPTHPDYRALVEALPRYQALARQGGWTSLSLEERLKAEGWLTDGMSTAEALQFYQAAYFLEPTGELDEETLKELSIPVTTRVQTIKRAINAWRESPTRFHDTYLRVNIPAFELEVWRDGKHIATKRSVNGALDGKTIELDRKIEELELNPPWYVPSGILHRDLLKRAKDDPDFLERHGFVVYRDKRTGSMRAMQSPGDHNWLGRVVFRWERKGSDGILIHDSPFQNRFALRKRALSHGCVNLEGAVPLARDIARIYGDVSGAEFDRLMATGETQKIRLKQPVHAFLEYVTAKADAQGRIVFLPDVYQHDPWNQKEVVNNHTLQFQSEGLN